MAFRWNQDFQESTVWPNPGEVRRMAAFAKSRGVTLSLANGHATVRDPRDPAPHMVTGYSCDCGLFAQAGGCQHLALLQSETSWIPEAVIAVSDLAAA